MCKHHFFFTVTVKLQLAELLDESVAEQLTEVVPMGKLDPDGGLHVTVTGLQLSTAVGAKLTISDLLPGPAVTVMLAGHAIVGGEAST